MMALPFVRSAALLLAALLPLLGGCRSASELIFEPEVTDPLDGYAGSLAQAGINTEMDWGPKQNLLLSEFKALNETHVQVERRLQQVLTENQNLQNQLADQGTSLQQEKALRAQAEAETEMLRQRRRELEARILSLSIEKAKLEQLNLLAKIDELRRSLDEGERNAAEAAAPLPGNR